MVAGFERRLHRGARRPFVAADQFDENVDIGGLRHLDRIVEPFRRTEINAAIAFLVARRDRG